MLPDIDLRLMSAIKALNEVVLPALPEDQAMAREQARLTVATLASIARHWQHALRFELTALAEMCALARDCLPHAPTADCAARLGAALDAQATLARDDYAAVSAALRGLGTLVAEVIDGDGSSAPMAPALQDAVLAHGERQALRERAWYAHCGLDPDAATLPPFDTLLD